MLLALLVILNIIFWGILLTYFCKVNLKIEERVAFGGAIGFIFFGYLLLLLSYLLGFGVRSGGMALLIINLSSLLWFFLYKKQLFTEMIDLSKRVMAPSWFIYYFFCMTFVFLLGFLAWNLLTFKDGRLFIELVHSYGDISLHLSIISSFALANNIPPVSPILVDTKISYPFMVDFLTAFFVNPLGLPVYQAIAITGTTFISLLVMGFLSFLQYFLESKRAALIGFFLFVFNGGLGFIQFLKDVPQFQGSFFQNWVKDYTSLKDQGFWWLNVVISMLLPQRSFLLGLPVSLFIIYLFWQCTKKFEIRNYLLAILLTATLPLVHSHSLIAIVPILIYLNLRIILKGKKPFVHYRLVITSLIVGGIGVLIAYVLSQLFLNQAEGVVKLLRYQPGWMANKEDAVFFFIKNFGFSLLLVPIFIYQGIRDKLSFIWLVVIAQIWFILPSIFIFQPWEFDNTKLYIYWYIFSVMAIAFYLNKMLTDRKQVENIFLAIFLLFSLTIAGFLDVSRLVVSNFTTIPDTKYEVYSPQAIKMGEFVASNTPLNARFLSIDKFDNPVLALAGRKSVVGYHGWLWTYGLDFSKQDEDVKRMLSGQASLETFKQYGVTHIILFQDPSDFVINKEYFKKTFPLIYDQDGYEIYKVI